MQYHYDTKNIKGGNKRKHVTFMYHTKFEA